MSVREPVVDALSDAASAALLEACRATNASGSELVSAVLTLTLQTMLSAKALGADGRVFREGVERLLMECCDDRQSASN